jgi:hypothetical protein
MRLRGRRATAIAAIMAATLVTFAGLPASPASGQAHEHEESDEGGGRIAVVLADHGEPPEYNQFTYWSFRKFFDHLIEMGLIPWWLKTLDNGTVLIDQGCFDCDFRQDAELMDAWLNIHEGPAAYVPHSDELPAHYVRPGGPGLGEPDIFEYVGVSAWHEWQLMGGRSPNYDQKLPKKLEVIRRLKNRYDSIPVAIGYGIDPRIGGAHQSIRQAVVKLINKERVDTIVMAYHGAGFSDIMQTHMLRHEVKEIVDELNPKVKVVFADPIGVSDDYVRAAVNKVRREVSRLPDNAPVAVHLSEHGLPLTECGDYDCGSDSYHELARKLFERTKAAVEKAIDRPGKFGVYQIYGESGEGDDNPDDKVDSPMEALKKRKKAGFDYVIDIPYAFDSDSRDTLIVLRRGHRRPIPDWNSRYESRFRYEGIKVKITNSQYGDALEIDAFEEVIVRAIESLK